MRTIAQYLEKAVEFELLADTSSNEGMQKRFADIAACYRLLARERERLIATGAISQDAIEMEISSGPSGDPRA